MRNAKCVMRNYKTETITHCAFLISNCFSEVSKRLSAVTKNFSDKIACRIYGAQVAAMVS